jgi:hypothetical protein
MPTTTTAKNGGERPPITGPRTRMPSKRAQVP